MFPKHRFRGRALCYSDSTNFFVTTHMSEMLETKLLDTVQPLVSWQTVALEKLRKCSRSIASWWAMLFKCFFFSGPPPSHNLPRHPRLIPSGSPLTTTMNHQPNSPNSCSFIAYVTQFALSLWQVSCSLLKDRLCA